MFATQVLPETSPEDDSQEGNASDVVGYLIIKEKKYEVKKGETKIGRDSVMCSIVIENFTVSKVHAVIESEGADDTFIYDAGSTNQTKLGKKVLRPHCRYKLDNNSKLTLGNVITEFILPPEKSSDPVLIINKLNPENLNPLDDLGDIFDIATQINTPETTTRIPVFEKPPECNSNFKVPTLVLPAKESLELSKNVFDEVTQCRLDLQESNSKTVVQEGLFESSNIFNLSTQCQLYESQALESKCGENHNDSCKNKEGDNIKSLLNDGQDDVLCVFMALHSPKEPNSVKIKTEVEDIPEVFDAPTQIEPPVQEEKIKLIDKPSITSTPFKSKSNQNGVFENNSTQYMENEDFMKTQEFEGVRVSENVNSLSQDEETQIYLGDTLDDVPITQQRSNDEDLILTQVFDSQQKTTTVIPESEDVNEIEDFMATQNYDVDNEMPGNEISAKAKTPPQLSQSSNDDRNENETLDFTQRNDQDDFIETQVFENVADLRKKDKNLGTDGDEGNNSANEEDFIATQSTDIPVSRIQNNNNNVPELRVEKSSRESSPDLLGSECTGKDTEDFIATQLFDASECQTSTNAKSCKRVVSSRFTNEADDCNLVQNKELVESSGDETESDLEIILEKTDTRNARECSEKSYKTELESEINTQPRDMETEENSNSSYIFELGLANPVEEVISKDVNQEQRGVANLSDSDETDCEEIAVVALKHSVKQEPLVEVESEETQLPENNQERTLDDVWMNGQLEESPKFESGIENGPRSPDLSISHVETNTSLGNESGVVEDYQIPSKIKKIEVGVNKSGREAESPLKRPLDNKDPDVVPVKKSKTNELDKLLKTSEKKLLKLVQAHDIAQIQPSRTRNSIRTITTENEQNKTDSSVTNEHQSSRRNRASKKPNGKNVNGDITSYLTTKKIETRRTSYRERVKETSPKEKKVEPKPVESSSRVLRSSRRNSGNVVSVENECPGKNVPIRKSRRISRTKSGEYFTSSCVNVVFTGFSCDSLDKIISELGGKKADDLSSGEVVVADKVRRTVKFLCAIGLGLPITSPEWLLSCKREQKFLNPWNFILKDEESEERYNFELKTSLERSKKVKLLEGFSVFATKNARPPIKELLAIVKSCGGTPLFNPPDVWPKKTIIVSCLEDQQWWPLPKLRNVKIVHYEFILGGVLRQKIDFNTYRLR